MGAIGTTINYNQAVNQNCLATWSPNLCKIYFKPHFYSQISSSLILSSHFPLPWKNEKYQMGTSYSQLFPSSNKGQPFYICSAFHLLFFPSRILIISTFGFYFNLFLFTRPYPSALIYALIIRKKQINKPTNHPSSILKNNKNSTPPPHPTLPPKNTLENSFL